jgi:tetratricopeptide (TPR) repeat protein
MTVKIDHAQLPTHRASAAPDPATGRRAAEFERLAASGQQALSAGDAAVAADTLRRALRMWRGPAMAGLPLSATGHAEVTALEERRLAVLDRRIEADLTAGRSAAVIGELRILVAEHPLRERLWALLMTALWADGRAAEALSVYTNARDQLNVELGIEPGGLLRNLQHRILTGQTSPGTHDMLAGAPTAAAPDAVSAEANPAAVPAQLPPDVRCFTGREAQLAQLDALIPKAGEQPTTVVIASVSGTAGVGKTALAVHWAHRIRERFPDGTLFVNLRGHDITATPMPPGEAVDSFLRALGVPPAAIPPSLEERSALLRTRLDGRRMLMVLDNAVAPEQVRWLLPGTPGSLVVVTSRSRLSGLVARDGAHRVAVDVLAPREALALLSEILGARVEAEPAAAQELVRLCGALPLALRLAAERVNSRPHHMIADLVRELGNEYDRLDLLAAGDDETSAVRAAFSWSYRALPDDAARMFRLLGLHPGPELGIEAAAALAGVTTCHARPVLETLTSMHLLEEVSRDRYRFHDLIRVYAVECAGADEASAACERALRRVLDWYLRHADAADRVMMPQRRHIPLTVSAQGIDAVEFPSPAAALQWCETERTNLVAATVRAAETGHHDVAWRLPFVLWSYFTVRKRWSDWIDTHRLGLAAAGTSGDRFGEALLFTSLANAYRDLRRFDEATELFHRAIGVARELGEAWVEAAALNLLGMVHRDRRRLDAAVSCGERSLAIFNAIDDPWGKAWAYHNLGESCSVLRRYDDAVAYCRQALALFRRVDDAWGESWSLSLLAQTHRGRGQLGHATTYATQALAAFRALGDHLGEGMALYTLGKIQHDGGQIDAARESWHLALAILDRLHAPQAATVRSRLAVGPAGASLITAHIR